MNQMKAISPIIATIIILLVTIAIAGAGYSYISTYWTSLVGKEIQVVSTFCAGEGQAKIMVKNIGTNPLKTGEIAVINPNTGEDLTQDVLWSSSVSDPSLVLELRFEEGSGTTAKDTSGQGNDGTFLPSGSGPTWTDGKIGNALSFDGNDDYVDTGLKINAGARSVFLWIKYNSLNGPGGHSLTGTQEGAASYTYTGIANGGQGYSYVADTGGTYNYYFTTGRWYSVGFTVDGVNTVRHYVDGAQVDTKIYSSDADASINFLIGRIAAGHNINGIIDEVRVYSRTLGDDEIKALAENSVPVQPGETATFTHACSGRCSYSLVLGGAAKETMVEC